MLFHDPLICTVSLEVLYLLNSKSNLNKTSKTNSVFIRIIFGKKKKTK
jgi:hypothetical protein